VEGAVIDMRDKDSQIKALRGMITELGELDSTIKKEQSSLKAFITSPEDRIRMPYARNETRSPRRTSFCGTVNPKDYLKDETGSRRFWTVPITKVDKTTLFSLPRDWINQLWFQTYRMFLENPAGFRLTDDEIKELQAENRDFEQLLPYEVEILDKLDFSMPMEDWEWWSSAEVAAILSGSADARKVGKAISKILKCNAPNSPNSPKFPKLERIYQGKPERLLPLRHFDQLGRKDRVSWGRYDELPL
jgi:predicted P-loop ATPase